MREAFGPASVQRPLKARKVNLRSVVKRPLTKWAKAKPFNYLKEHVAAEEFSLRQWKEIDCRLKRQRVGVKTSVKRATVKPKGPKK